MMTMMQTSVIFLRKPQILLIMWIMAEVRFWSIASKEKVGAPQLSLPTWCWECKNLGYSSAFKQISCYCGCEFHWNFAIYVIEMLLFQGFHSCKSLELTKEGAPPCSTKWRLCQGSPGPRQEASWQGVYGLAAQAAWNEGVSNLQQECRAEHELAQAAPAEGAQATLRRKCRQCHDHGDPEVNWVAPDQPRWESEPVPEADQGVCQWAGLLIHTVVTCTMPRECTWFTLLLLVASSCRLYFRMVRVSVGP